LHGKVQLSLPLSNVFNKFRRTEHFNQLTSFSGSKIRAAVAMVPFDEFHRHSAQVIQFAVFGNPATDQFVSELKFPANNLVSTNIMSTLKI